MRKFRNHGNRELGEGEEIGSECRRRRGNAFRGRVIDTDNYARVRSEYVRTLRIGPLSKGRNSVRLRRPVDRARASGKCARVVSPLTLD